MPLVEWQEAVAHLVFMHGCVFHQLRTKQERDQSEEDVDETGHFLLRGLNVSTSYFEELQNQTTVVCLRGIRLFLSGHSEAFQVFLS